MRHRFIPLLASLGLAGALVGTSYAVDSAGGSQPTHPARLTTDPAATAAAQETTTTPVKHLVVIFDENVSFDHYFGTYPYAANPPGEPQFKAKPGTPTVNNLVNSVASTGAPSGPLLDHNANESNPVRLDRNDPMTCDQDHGYTAEQLAADHGAEDMYAQNTGRGVTLAQCLTGEKLHGTQETVPPGATSNYAVMDYYDGNTVTGLWNYAQHFAMSDNAYGTTYGPSTPGALNVTSAQTYGGICGPSYATINDATCTAPPGLTTTSPTRSDITTVAPTKTNPNGTTSVADQPKAGSGTTYRDADPRFTVCSYLPTSEGGDGDTPGTTVEMGGNNIGEELTAANVTWGWFEGGFDHGYVPGEGGKKPTTAKICSEEHKDVGGTAVVDYIPHHDPFQYYASTANPMHMPPTSVPMIGHTDQANHNYDIADFWAAADNGNLPAVSYLKAPAYQDGHAGYSDPLDEQTWLVNTINHLETLRTWSSTAVVITWDDSDGWYDQELAPVVSGSQTSLDKLTGTGTCGLAKIDPTTTTGKVEAGKCGPGPRLPFLVISPYAKSNDVSNMLIDQSSVVKFIEDNWHLPALGNGAADTAAGSILSMFDFTQKSPPLYLNATSGEPVSRASLTAQS
jgi:phospholipase C